MEDKRSLTLCVKVIPKAHRTEIIGWEGDELKIRLKAIPEKGEANKTLISFLALKLDISKSQIELIAGATSRHKKLIIYGITESHFKLKLL